MTTTLEAISDDTLDNGLRVVYEPMPWLPTVSMTLQLPVGTSNDPADAVGTASVLSEWLHRGAGDLGARAHASALDALGVRRGGGVGRETLVVSAAFLARDAGPVLGLLADMVRRPRLDDLDFVGVRQLALHDLDGLADEPAQRLGEALMAHYFASAHGRSAIGERAHLESLTAERVRTSAHERLGPGAAVLALAGGLEPEAMEDAVAAAFGDWRGGSVPLPSPERRPAGTHHVDADSAQVQIGMAAPAVGPTDDGWYAQQLAMTALDGNMGARLFTEVREKRGLVYSVGASTRLVRGHALTVARAGTTPERADETVAVLQHELDRLSDGIDAEEYARAERQLRSSMVMQSEGSGARASRLASDVLHLGRPRPLGETLAALEATTLEDVNAFLAGRDRGGFTVVTLGPRVAAGRSAGAA